MALVDPQETHDYVILNGCNAAHCGPPVEIVGRQYPASSGRRVLHPLAAARSRPRAVARLGNSAIIVFAIGLQCPW
jgi:hypothetical protein